MSVILYSTKCPKCKILEDRLNRANIDFEEVNDIDIMMQKGLKSAPILEVDNTLYGFKEAVEWIKEQ